ncbi:MAG TPA: tRNA 2-thiouridine(34) synthase MnmA [Spirochaetota bacterium]|mgnify:CR=1 FL=1|nr:tRNA 2-thiouridine(34) synthase MnmA [Spirochaetota bacterium]HOD15340.1 tRNA 2-thiouridine(34) synthase MnmA [Spirochaetota bacterium]HPG50275.1 tRNA 2-thiouridine(34) synthase MnmA [Spirochaetota bacterium]HPN12747.1 tRNA 2-thiouridine(34) synthase MnmA [Spirochaetota bacterium]
MKIAVAMSGGLDSSMAAVLLKEAGNDVMGITAELSAGLVAHHYGPPGGPSGIESARSVAESLGIPFHVADLQAEFSSLIVEPFCEEYLRGRTPNPCVRCNAMIKFDLLLRRARELGCEKIATGHYAAIGRAENGRYFVTRGGETIKDQSYFLFMLSQEALSDILFPLGGFTKAAVREMAKARGLAVAERPESQEICFIPDNRYAEFIERSQRALPGPGDITDSAGTVIGKHRGIHRYTIGQRRGLGIASPRPLYVTAIDAPSNRIIAGQREELYAGALVAVGINYMKETALDGLRVLAKTRSTQPPVDAHLSADGASIVVTFTEPQAGISPGQAVVFYNDRMEVLAGGIIERSLPVGTGPKETSNA